MLPLNEIKQTAIETWGGVIAMALAINEQIPQTNTGSHAWELNWPTGALGILFIIQF